MLVLSRNIGQKIIIQDGDKEIEIVVVGFRNGKVRLGFDAPKEIKIYREEVAERIAADEPAPLTGSNNDGKSTTGRSNKEKQENKMWRQQKGEQRKSRFTHKTK